MYTVTGKEAVVGSPEEATWGLEELRGTQVQIIGTRYHGHVWGGTPAGHSNKRDLLYIKIHELDQNFEVPANRVEPVSGDVDTKSIVDSVRSWIRFKKVG